jgi:patatin-like phospholipase/acyl hydrolase
MAGVRILSLDSGGVHGIITLTILERLESNLAYLGYPLRNHFDFIARTSSGKFDSGKGLASLFQLTVL